MSASSHFILGTAGHVDHGKSALVKALTGTDPDRLPEEKARSITIDLGFASLELASSHAEGGPFHVGIVDVPGHEDFVKNMVAGVGSIQVALLVVAADDGWMPQTEEHLQILTYLGVTRAVVALSKVDLVAPDRELAVVQSLGDQLQETAFAQAPIVPCSVVSGRGLDDLKLTLTHVLAGTPPAPDIGKPRLPIDRAFALRGVGTVVTGTLIGGCFERGQVVVVQPDGSTGRIRTIQSHGRDQTLVGPGTRVALNLSDLAVDSKASKPEGAGVRRGDVVTLRGLGESSDTLDVLLDQSPRLATGHAGTARALKDGAKVHLHHGTGHTAARLVLLEKKQVAPGERVLAQLRLETPAFAFAGDRFIVRDWAEQATLAGGVILDPDASRRSCKGRIGFLQRRADSPHDVSNALESLLARDGLARPGAVLVKSGFSAPEIAAAITRLQTAGRIVQAGDQIVNAGQWTALRTKATELVCAYHRAHPDRPGLPLNELRAALEPELPAAGLFGALLAHVTEAGLVQTGTVIKRTTHRPALPAHMQAAATQVRSGLTSKPMDPPSRKELAPNAATQQALRFLIQAGEAVELNSEIVLLADSYAKAVRLIQGHLRDGAAATVSELRQVVGASRRIVVPLLEHLDRAGITRRQGEVRVLRQGRSS